MRKTSKIFATALVMLLVFLLVPYGGNMESIYGNEYVEEGGYYGFGSLIYPVGNCDDEIDIIINALSSGQVTENDLMNRINYDPHEFSKTGYERFFAAGYMTEYVSQIVAAGGLPAGYSYSGSSSSSSGGGSTGSSSGSNTKPSSNSSSSSKKHEHTYTEAVTTEATCSEAGVKTFTCECGETYTEEIAALVHSYVSEVTKKASCLEDGETTYTCELCNDTYTETLSSTGHKEGKWEVVKASGTFC